MMLKYEEERLKVEEELFTAEELSLKAEDGGFCGVGVDR